MAFDVRTDVFLQCEYHNTEIKLNGYERISIVCYYREYMHARLSAEKELEQSRTGS